LNVIPNECEAGFDIRIPAGRDLQNFENELKELLCEENVEYTKIRGAMVNESTRYVSFVLRISIDPEKNKWWAKFAETCAGLDMKIQPGFFPAATDSRYLRELNIPAIGFTPLTNTVWLNL
jgi:aminoacylase